MKLPKKFIVLPMAQNDRNCYIIPPGLLLSSKSVAEGESGELAGVLGVSGAPELLEAEDSVLEPFGPFWPLSDVVDVSSVGEDGVAEGESAVPAAVVPSPLRRLRHSRYHSSAPLNSSSETTSTACCSVVLLSALTPGFCFPAHRVGQ